MQGWFTIHEIIKDLLTFPFKFWNQVGNTTKMPKTFTTDTIELSFLDL